MTFREVIRVLRHMRDVLAEYVATEKRKRAEAKHQAEEVARREAEEVAAREAELQAAQERLFARAVERPSARRRSRRGDGAKASAPLTTIPLPPVTTDIFNFETLYEAPPPGLHPGLPPNLVALFTQLDQLDAALRALFTVTDRTRAWFERIQAHPFWGSVVRGLSMGLATLTQRISSRMFHRERLAAHQRHVSENWERVRRMHAGDWKEKVRYILWTNGRRQERAALAAESEPASTFAAAVAGW